MNIKSCPFCGGSCLVYKNQYGDSMMEYFAVGCSVCEVGSIDYDTEVAAIEAWNKRHHGEWFETAVHGKPKDGKKVLVQFLSGVQAFGINDGGTFCWYHLGSDRFIECPITWNHIKYWQYTNIKRCEDD